MQHLIFERIQQTHTELWNIKYICYILRHTDITIHYNTRLSNTVQQRQYIIKQNRDNSLTLNHPTYLRYYSLWHQQWIAFLHCETLFLACWTIYSQSSEPFPSLLVNNCLLGMLFSYQLVSLTCSRWTCSQVCRYSCPSLFGTCCKHQNQNICHKQQWGFNIKYLVYVVYSMEYKLKKNCKSLC